MNTPVSLLAIALNTARELARNKLLYLLLLFALLLIGASLLLASLTIGQWERIINDVGLATVQLGGVLVAVLVGAGVVAGEVDRRTLYVALAKPVSRGAFVAGRYLGLCATLFVIVALEGIALSAVLAAAGFPMGATGAAALLLIFVELVVLAGLATLFSTFTTTTLAAILALATFVIGHLAGELAALAAQAEGPQSWVLLLISRIVPRLDLLDLKAHAANQLPIDPAFVASVAAHGLGYATATLLLGMAVFARRDLK
jgi:ABC-type transport system involved in multi-copper enzyme maturation permease subunit